MAPGTHTSARGSGELLTQRFPTSSCINSLWYGQYTIYSLYLRCIVRCFLFTLMLKCIMLLSNVHSFHKVDVLFIFSYTNGLEQEEPTLETSSSYRQWHLAGRVFFIGLKHSTIFLRKCCQAHSHLQAKQATWMLNGSYLPSRWAQASVTGAER